MMDSFSVGATSYHNVNQGIASFFKSSPLIVKIMSRILGVGDKVWYYLVMSHKDKSIIIQFKERIPAKIRKQLARIIIFGSRADGKVSRYSDLDVAVLVKRKTSQLEKHLEDIAYDLMLEHDFQPVISLKVFSQEDFERRYKQGFSFYRHVREGVVV